MKNWLNIVLFIWFHLIIIIIIFVFFLENEFNVLRWNRLGRVRWIGIIKTPMEYSEEKKERKKERKEERKHKRETIKGRREVTATATTTTIEWYRCFSTIQSWLLLFIETKSIQMHQPEEMRSAKVRVRHLHLDVRTLPQTRRKKSTLASIGILITNQT